MNNYFEHTCTVSVPKVIAKITLCGALAFEITDDMPFEIPTAEQRKALKETFNIEVELFD